MNPRDIAGERRRRRSPRVLPLELNVSSLENTVVGGTVCSGDALDKKEDGGGGCHCSNSSKRNSTSNGGSMCFDFIDIRASATLNESSGSCSSSSNRCLHDNNYHINNSDSNNSSK